MKPRMNIVKGVVVSPTPSDAYLAKQYAASNQLATLNLHHP